MSVGLVKHPARITANETGKRLGAAFALQFAAVTSLVPAFSVA